MSNELSHYFKDQIADRPLKEICIEGLSEWQQVEGGGAGGSAGVWMFKRGWLGIGAIRSDEGYSVSYGHRSVRYRDERGEIEVGFEDGFLFPESAMPLDSGRILGTDERSRILGRIQEVLQWDGRLARIFETPSQPKI